jgi:acyl carrier protein
MEDADTADRVFSARIVAIIASQNLAIDAGKITTATSLKELQFDSFDAVTLMFALEEEFGVEIADDDARDFKTVGDVIARLRALCGVPTATS